MADLNQGPTSSWVSIHDGPRGIHNILIYWSLVTQKKCNSRDTAGQPRTSEYDKAPRRTFFPRIAGNSMRFKCIILYTRV